MTWSARRKLIYLLIFITITVVLVGVPAYILTYEKPSCFDEKQNQREDGIDCGGPCVKLCKPLELLPVTLWQQTFKVSKDNYTAVAYIQNPNIQARAFNVPYSFKIFDSSNTLLTEKTGKVYIPAGKNFAITETNISISKGEPKRTEFSFTDMEQLNWVVSPAVPDIKIQNIVISNDSSPSVTADVTNSSFIDAPKINFTAIVHDESGTPIAVSKTYIDYLDNQSTAHIVFTWPEEFTSVPATVDIIPVI